MGAGGTTLFVLNCVNMLGYDCKMYSIDIASEFHLNKTKKCGYQIEKGKDYFDKRIEHKLLLGKPIPYVIEEIYKESGTIDLVILDTTHYMPGELLDYIICFPYLNKNAVVIMDDLDFAHYGENVKGIATRVLFSTSVGEKLYSTDPMKDKMAGFIVDERARENIDGIFSGLKIPWNYSLNDDIGEYKNIIKKNYSFDYVRYFDEICELGERTARRNVRFEIDKLINKAKMGHDIFIYGAGKRGKALRFFLESRGLKISGFVVSDDRMDENNHNGTICLSELSKKNDNVIFLAVANEEAKNNLITRGIEYVEIPNYVFPFLKDYYSFLAD